MQRGVIVQAAADAGFEEVIPRSEDLCGAIEAIMELIGEGELKVRSFHSVRELLSPQIH